jgi:predicted RNase H-like HicB family nuclease
MFSNAADEVVHDSPEEKRKTRHFWSEDITFAYPQTLLHFLRATLSRASVSKLMNIHAEFGREEDGQWVAQIPGLPEARAYGSTRREAAIGVTILAFQILAERVESGELQVEDQPGAIIVGGTAGSLSELFLEQPPGHTPSPEPIVGIEESERQGDKSFISAEEPTAKSDLTEASDSLIPGPVVAPRTLADYHRLRDMLEDLIAKVGADESHPLAAFMDRVGTLVEQYESTHLSEIIESKQKR